MLVWKKIIWLRERVREQKSWIDQCGSNLAGYIARYGDPGVAPLDAQGNPQVVKIVYQDIDTTDLIPVPDVPDTFYKPHVGDGGTAIYDADSSRLHSWQRQLSELEVRNYAAKVKADTLEP